MEEITKKAIRFTDIETGSIEEELLENLEAIHIMPVAKSIIAYYITFASGVYQVNLETYNFAVDYVELNYPSNNDANLNLKLPIKKVGKYNKELITLSNHKNTTSELLEDLYSITITINNKKLFYNLVFEEQYSVNKTSYNDLVRYLKNKTQN